MCTDATTPPPLKTLVLVHRSAGYKLLLRMAAKRFGLGAVRGFPPAPNPNPNPNPNLNPNSNPNSNPDPNQVRGFPPARTAAERSDPALLELLGGPHDEQAAQPRR